MQVAQRGWQITAPEGFVSDWAKLGTAWSDWRAALAWSRRLDERSSEVPANLNYAVHL